MKPLKLIIIVIILFFASVAQAQVTLHAKMYSPPPWGPVGYNDVRYY